MFAFVFSLGCVFLCSHLPYTFEGLVPILAFYLQGFSSSFIILSSFSRNLEVVPTWQQKIAAHIAIVTSVLILPLFNSRCLKQRSRLAMALRQKDLNFLRAACSGDRDAVETALAVNNVDKNCRENTGYHYTAVQRGALSNESVVDILIDDAGVQPNLTDDLGRTLLHLSWRTCVQKLQTPVASLKMGPADWDLRDNIHQTPLLCQARFVNLPIVSDLLGVTLPNGQPAVDMHKKTIDEFTVLHQVVEQDPRSFPAWYRFRPRNERSKLVGMLLEELKRRERQRRQVGNLSQEAGKLQSGVLTFVNKRDKLNRSALHYIAEEGCVEILNTLLDFFTDQRIRSRILVNILDFHGLTPLHLAVRGGHEGVVEQLLQERRINPNFHTTVDKRNKIKLQKYEENHRELCRPDLSSKVPIEQYSGKGLTPLHLAAMNGHTRITDLLLQSPGVPRGPAPPGDFVSPLEYSIMNRHFQVAARLLIDRLGWPAHPMDPNDWWRNVDTVLCLAEGPDDRPTANSLLTRSGQLTRPLVPIAQFVDGDIELLLSVAAMENRHEIIRHILKWTPEVKVHIKSQWPQYAPLDATPLHFAVLEGHRDAVRELLTHLPLDANSEDSFLRTPLEIATNIADSNTRREIERLLMGRPEVKELVDRLYRDRQVFIDAANALLVGAALIASVTFAGWLQPPLGYNTYYDYPESLPAPPGTYESFAAVKQHADVRAFWFFNSLSFFFAIATVLTGANAAMPSLENEFIGTVVKSVRGTLIHVSILLAISVACVLGAFVTAGFAVLPRAAKYNWSMISTVAIGLSVCLFYLACFLCKLSKPNCLRLRTHPQPGGAQNLEPGGAQNLAPGGAQNLEPGGAQNLEPGGAQNLEPGGAQNLAPGGAENLAPGGAQNLAPGGAQNLEPGGEQQLEPGGEQNLEPGPPSEELILRNSFNWSKIVSLEDTSKILKLEEGMQDPENLLDNMCSQ